MIFKRVLALNWAILRDLPNTSPNVSPEKGDKMLRRYIPT
jgi:hypothetical protein